MIRETYIEQSLAKVERSSEIAEEIFEQCGEFAASEDNRVLVRTGSLLGDFSNNLRSALNYCARNIILGQLEGKIGAKHIRKLNQKLDFPWANTKAEFDDKPIIKTIRTISRPLYDTLEQFQPYYRANQWLEYLMRLSNRDKHEIINKITSPTGSAFLAVGPDGNQINIPEPIFSGEKLIIFEDGEPITVALPYYFPWFKSYATPKHKWLLFLVPMTKTFSLDLIDFTRTTPQNVANILSSLISKFAMRTESKSD